MQDAGKLLKDLLNVANTRFLVTGIIPDPLLFYVMKFLLTSSDCHVDFIFCCNLGVGEQELLFKVKDRKQWPG
jgi:hypothetical protein